MKRLLIIGAGGHGKVVAEVAKDVGYEEIAFLDDISLEAIGKISEIENSKINIVTPLWESGTTSCEVN